MANRNTPGRKKGTPKTGGRQKGTPNKVTSDIRAFAQALVERPGYQRKFLAAWDARELHPRLEEMIWHYAHGKPTQPIEAQIHAEVDVLAQILNDNLQNSATRRGFGSVAAMQAHDDRDRLHRT